MKYLFAIYLVAGCALAVASNLIPASNELFSIFNIVTIILLIVGISAITRSHTMSHYIGIAMFSSGAGMQIAKYVTLDSNYTYGIIFGIIALLSFCIANWARKPEKIAK